MSAPLTDGDALEPGAFDIAETLERELSRAFWRFAALHELTGAHLEMKGQLVVDIVLGDEAKQRSKRLPPTHGFAACASRAAKTAAA
jgi:hypothetical protein